MLKLKHTGIPFILLILLTSTGYAQTIKQISISANSEAIGLPFTNYLPLHPGFELRTTLAHKETTTNAQQFNVNLGGFFHRKVQNSFYVGGEYQYTQKLFKEKLGLTIPVGLGYLHSFYPGDLYEQNENGDFENVQQLGRPHFYLKLGIGVSYLGNARFQPFIRQEMMIETPFANGIPFIPHSFISVGLTFKIQKNEK